MISQDYTSQLCCQAGVLCLGDVGLNAKFKFFILMFLGTAFMGCDVQEYEIPRGDFLRATGNQIYVINFVEGKNELLFSFPAGEVIHNKLWQIDEQTILLSMQESAEIVSLDLVTKKVRRIGFGDNPVYMKKHKKIMYYGKDNEGKGALLVADAALKNPQKIFELNQRDALKIVKTSSDEVVFMRSELDIETENWQNVLWKYDLTTNSLVRIEGFSDCRLLNIWRSKGGQLICQKKTSNRFDSYYYLVDLLNKTEERIDYSGYLNIGEYVEELDSLIVQKLDVRGGYEIYDLWLFDLSNNTELKLMEGSGFAFESFLRLRE